MAHQQRHPNYTHTFIDSCAFDPDDVEEEKCSRRLLARYNNGEIVLQITHSVQKEIDHPNTPNDVKALAQALIYTVESELTPELLRTRKDIRALVRGNAKEGTHEKDADHIFELYKYGGGYFVTTDNRLLSLSEQLFARYFVTTIKSCKYEALL